MDVKTLKQTDFPCLHKNYHLHNSSLGSCQISLKLSNRKKHECCPGTFKASWLCKHCQEVHLKLKTGDKLSKLKGIKAILPMSWMKLVECSFVVNRGVCILVLITFRNTGVLSKVSAKAILANLSSLKCDSHVKHLFLW